MAVSAITSKKAFGFIFSILRLFPLGIAIMFMVAIIWALDVSVRPYILKIIINRVSDLGSHKLYEYLAIPLSVYIFMTFLFSTNMRMYQYFIEIKMLPRMRKTIAESSFGALLEQSHHFYQNNFAGSLANKVNDLIQYIPQLLQIALDRFLSHFLALVIAIFTLATVNFRFALILLIWCMLFLSFAYFASKKLTRLSALFSEQLSVLTGYMVDVLSNILSVRLFSRRADEKKSFSQTIEKVIQADIKLEWGYFWFFFFYGYSFAFMQVFNLYYLMKGRYEGWITLGDFVLVLSLNLSLSEFLWELGKQFSEFSKMLGKVTQGLGPVLHLPSIKNKKGSTELQVSAGEIVFDAVQFNYEGAENIFTNKSVTIQPGQKVGLVGYSGSGKTTFVNLILRLFEVNGGQICIDGQNISMVTQESLRQKIGMIPQDPTLFHRTLRDNIAYGDASASDDAVIAAAKKAYAHEFIINLPQQYESLVGERGVKLSGGQRQRIAIARAFLKNAPILILDEATSQLDSVTEHEIQESLWELMQNKTTLVIAHRLSTLMKMDRILVFDQGKIIEDGAHKELLAQNGLYTTLWNAQVGGFLLDTEV